MLSTSSSSLPFPPHAFLPTGVQIALPSTARPLVEVLHSAAAYPQRRSRTIPT